MTEQQTPWLRLRDVCHFYGCTMGTAKNKIMMGTFPVPTYKVGKEHVVDRVVHERFFLAKREAGLRALETTNS